MKHEHKQFKPYDRVIARYEDTDKWICDLYSHRDKELSYLHVLVSGRIIEEHDILPYEGNEHLVGTTGAPEEEIELKEGEWIFALTSIQDDERICHPANLNGSTLCKFKGIYQAYTGSPFRINTSIGGGYLYCIRFSDFNPSDMEETRQHILCVENEKIVRYKE